ncbi:hypothetical protein E1267_41370 [Nonomuraea longispora]|uniref:Uncharacterized protein n=1 Tax=Nonomuraea longispora TaxID=1848320 RepID=A0A4R4MNV8_9ACTN|nr:hypothetical protein [Nonomuraea longispora]TDB95972.1 hypothetical protein E1267_41370 [Nonomuraea longispora]
MADFAVVVLGSGRGGQKAAIAAAIVVEVVGEVRVVGDEARVHVVDHLPVFPAAGGVPEGVDEGGHGGVGVPGDGGVRRLGDQAGLHQAE